MSLRQQQGAIGPEGVHLTSLFCRRSSQHQPPTTPRWLPAPTPMASHETPSGGVIGPSYFGRCCSQNPPPRHPWPPLHHPLHSSQPQFPRRPTDPLHHAPPPCSSQNPPPRRQLPPHSAHTAPIRCSHNCPCRSIIAKNVCRPGGGGAGGGSPNWELGSPSGEGAGVFRLTLWAPGGHPPEGRGAGGAIRLTNSTPPPRLPSTLPRATNSGHLGPPPRQKSKKKAKLLLVTLHPGCWRTPMFFFIHTMFFSQGLHSTYTYIYIAHFPFMGLTRRWGTLCRTLQCFRLASHTEL